MVNRTLLSIKLIELAARVAQIRRHRKASVQELEADRDAAELAEALRSGAGLRNWIAHGYSGVDLSLVHRAATDGVGDLEAFARAVAHFANGQA